MAMIWLNWSIAKINVTLQLLDIYKCNKQETNHMCNCLLREREREREREIVLESLILLFHPLDFSPNLAHSY